MHNIGNYYFEMDERAIHIYKGQELEYFDMIEFDYNLDNDEFVYQCKTWFNSAK